MTSKSKIFELLRRYEQLREQGQDVQPETLCQDSEMSAAVREEMRKWCDGASPLASTDPAETVVHAPPANATPESGIPNIDGYQVYGELARGGMGVVYKAQHLQLKRLVALKMILADNQIGEQERTRFRMEAEAVARLQHPNIVQIFAVGEHEGTPFCALEFVEGGSLAVKIAATPQPARWSAELVEKLSRAVHAAHERGFVHRDLKPANVLMSTNDIPKIADFGLAKQLDNESGQTRSGAIVGTPSYMSPEQASGRGHEIGPPTDVYALGAILYELLTGRPHD
jgi:serine/threonine-protein kinase